MKKSLAFVQLVVTLLILLADNNVYAKTSPPPPLNDECSGAIIITPTSTNTYTTYDNLNSTVSSVPPPSCATPISGDVWFAVMVSSSGHLIFDAVTGSMTDGGMAIYSGGCGSLSLIACNDNKSTGFPPNDNMPQIDKIGLPMYMMIYIRFWGKGANNFGTFQLTVISSPTQPPCTNLGFENGLYGWFTTMGQQYDGAAGAATPVYFPISFNNMTNPNIEIQTSGTDPNCGFQKVYSGNKSIRLGDLDAIQTYDAASVEQTFTVGPNNTSFTYHYALVFSLATHPDNLEKFFKVEVFDANGNIDSCGTILLTPSNSTYITNTANGVKYKPWTMKNIDLSAYIGQNVTVRFTVSDCSSGGCRGYAYLDCDCEPYVIKSSSDTVCSGNPDTLTAPAGAISYLWTPLNMTTQSIIVAPHFTTTYFCFLPNSGTGNCLQTLSKTIYVVQTGLPVPDSAGMISSNGNNNVSQGQNYVLYKIPTLNNADKYEWTYSGNGVSFSPSNITLADSVFLNFSLTATSGDLKVRGLNNCGGIGAFSANYPINVAVGVNEHLVKTDIGIYPNPAKNNLIIELNGNNVKQNTVVSIYNIQGQLLKQTEIKENKTAIDIRSFATGVYIIKLNNQKETLVSRFVKD
ncbi:MAG: T9SS type A sorting domain-containing protein [Bacteroidetes bacterium]|nr:T9SS type A sorting domain-containing protein [Bacteroidota bacterium]